MPLTAIHCSRRGACRVLASPSAPSSGVTIHRFRDEPLGTEPTVGRFLAFERRTRACTQTARESTKELVRSTLRLLPLIPAIFARCRFRSFCAGSGVKGLNSISHEPPLSVCTSNFGRRGTLSPLPNKIPSMCGGAHFATSREVAHSFLFRGRVRCGNFGAGVRTGCNPLSDVRIRGSFRIFRLVVPHMKAVHDS